MVDVRPGNAEGVVPIPHRVKVETSRGEGWAIALDWTGVEMLYLVVSSSDLARPKWISESEVNAAYIDGRPGAEPMVASVP
jgi:hypothetical protein